MFYTVKIALIVITATCYHRSYTPPSVTETPNEQKKALKTPSVTLAERLIPAASLLTKSLYWTLSVVEIASILALKYAGHDAASYFRDQFGLNNAPRAAIVALLRPTATHLVGSLLIITGTLIRLRCYREMGRHFTFRLSLRDGHKLITSGPYSIVRHPSYTAGLMTVVGCLCTLAGDGSWLREVGYATPFGKFCVVVLMVNFGVCVRPFLRADQEDAFLREEFGKQWDEWADAVPYRYVPGIY